MSEHNSTAGLLVDCKVLMMDAARGLGLAFAKSVTEAGGAAVPANIPDERAQEEATTLRAVSFGAHGFIFDLGDLASIQACAVTAAQALGGLDDLVNNAAVTNSGGHDTSSIDTETWDRMMSVDMCSTWLMTAVCLPALETSGRGAIVNLSSSAPLWGTPGLLAYVVNKSAVIGMTKSLAREYGADGIIVNIVAPGLMLVETIGYVPAHRHALYHDQRAISRDQLPDDMRGAVLLTLSDLFRLMTGQMLIVNGGLVM